MENEQFYWSVVTILVVDGGTDVKELQFLQQLRQELNIPQDVARSILVEARKGTKRIHLPTDPEEKQRLLDYLVQAAFANETIDPKEQQALEAVARKLELPLQELSQSITHHTPAPGTTRRTPAPSGDQAASIRTTSSQQRDRKDKEDENENLIREVQEYQQNVRKLTIKCILFSFFCVVLPYVTLTSFIPLYCAWNALRETAVVPATIRSFEFYHRRSRSGTKRTSWIHLEIMYSYEYNGQCYTSDRITMSPHLMSDDYKQKMSSPLNAAYQQGTPIDCYVSVTKPEIAVLDREFYPMTFMFWVGVVLVLFTALLTVVALIILKLLGKVQT